MKNSKKFLRQTADRLILENKKTVVRAHFLDANGQLLSEGSEEFVLAQGETLSAHLRKSADAGRIYIDDFENTGVAA